MNDQSYRKITLAVLVILVLGMLVITNQNVLVGKATQNPTKIVRGNIVALQTGDNGYGWFTGVYAIPEGKCEFTLSAYPSLGATSIIMAQTKIGSRPNLKNLITLTIADIHGQIWTTKKSYEFNKDKDAIYLSISRSGLKNVQIAYACEQPVK